MIFNSFHDDLAALLVAAILIGVVVSLLKRHPRANYRAIVRRVR